MAAAWRSGVRPWSSHASTETPASSKSSTMGRERSATAAWTASAPAAPSIAAPASSTAHRELAPGVEQQACSCEVTLIDRVGERRGTVLRSVGPRGRQTSEHGLGELRRAPLRAPFRSAMNREAQEMSRTNLGRSLVTGGSLLVGQCPFGVEPCVHVGSRQGTRVRVHAAVEEQLHDGEMPVQRRRVKRGRTPEVAHAWLDAESEQAANRALVPCTRGLEEWFDLRVAVQRQLAIRVRLHPCSPYDRWIGAATRVEGAAAAGTGTGDLPVSRGKNARRQRGMPTAPGTNVRREIGLARDARDTSAAPDEVRRARDTSVPRATEVTRDARPTNAAPHEPPSVPGMSGRREVGTANAPLRLPSARGMSVPREPGTPGDRGMSIP